jgi:uncharacterized membrane protein YfcA
MTNNSLPISLFNNSRFISIFVCHKLKTHNNKNSMKMSISTILILLIIGTITGVMAGMLGIGGGLVVIPALVMVMGMSQQGAQGTSLAMMLPPIGILAAYNYYKAGHVDIKFAMILAIAFIIGSYFGSKLAVKLPQDVLKKIFGAFLLLVAVKMLFWK